MSRMLILSPLDGRVIPLEEVPDEGRDHRHSGEPSRIRHPV